MLAVLTFHSLLNRVGPVSLYCILLTLQFKRKMSNENKIQGRKKMGLEVKSLQERGGNGFQAPFWSLNAQ